MGFFSVVKKWWKGDYAGADSSEATSQEISSKEASSEELASQEVVTDTAPSTTSLEEPTTEEKVEEIQVEEVQGAITEPAPESAIEPEPVPQPVVEPEADPVVVEAPLVEEIYAVEETPVVEDVQIEAISVVEEIPVVEEIQAEEVSVAEEILVVEEIPAVEEVQVEETPVIEEVQSEATPVVEEVSIVDEAPAIEEAPIVEEVPAVEEIQAAVIEEPELISPRDMPSEGISEQLEPWQAELTLALRQAEPRLSVWLSHVLQGVEEVDENLWTRVRFFFKALEVPSDEAENFINDFSRWLNAMDYYYVDDFRSELQYRLALALDLEDEEDERSRLMLKLSEGLARTREHIGRRIDSLLASHKQIDEAFWEELEEILITADVGYEPSMELVGRLRRRAQAAGTDDPERFRDLLREELEEIFKGQRRIAAVNPPEVVLMIGVNGVGKTTTIAKLAYRARMQGKKVLIAAADTFRAAACEQLQVWAERVGAGFHTKGANADPAAVAYEAMDIAVAEGYDILFVDTAGRLHTKVNLMEELHKIRKVLGKKHAGAPHRSILVIDATTGQNALSQTKLFGEACGIDEIILTKLDGTAKGGVVVAVAMQFGIPITYIGLGEKMEDLRPFDGGDFAMALLGLDAVEK